MPIELVNTYLTLPLFALVASRLAGVVMFLPAVGGMAVPAKVRALLVIGLAALVTPLLAGPEPAVHWSGVSEPWGLAQALGGELAIGALMGLAVRVCFDGVQAGAQLIAQESGMAFGQVVDPSSGMESDTVSVLYVQLATVVFLIVGGHRLLLAAAVDTFSAVPPLAAVGVIAPGLDTVIDALTAGGALALKVAAPVVVTLLLVQFALGFISRTVPQLNVATVGFSLKGMVAFVLMAAALPMAMEAFVDTVERVFEEIVHG